MQGANLIIPVIDILNCKVVHAVRGKRSEYQPLKSILIQSVQPLEVAKVFKILGFKELYIADLDAITKGQLNLHLIKQIADETGLKLMVDAGVDDLEKAEKLLDNGVSRIVIGTETLQNKNFVSDAVWALGRNRIIVSLDLNKDKLLIKSGVSDDNDPLCLLNEFEEMGVSSVIILDLSRVGSGEGVNIDFLKKALDKKTMQVYVGGGVRDINDLLELKELGVSGVLIATSLHSGKISIEELKKNDLLLENLFLRQTNKST
jgi:phosphoribosylformimino-5-aminoimidazole carboxamide ribotide isomerase